MATFVEPSWHLHGTFTGTFMEIFMGTFMEPSFHEGCHEGHFKALCESLSITLNLYAYNNKDLRKNHHNKADL